MIADFWNLQKMIQGFGFSGYRSVGKDLIKVGPLKKINLIIGQNNTGKSNIIRFLNEHYNNILNSLNPDRLLYTSGSNLSFKSIDTSQSGGSFKPRFALCTNISDLEIIKNPKIDKIVRSSFCVDIKDRDYVWFEYSCDALNHQYYPLIPNVDELLPILESHEWQALWSSLTGKGSGSLREYWIPQTMQHIFEKIRLDPQKIELIPDIRRIGDPETQANDFSGLGIIDRLAQLQNPSLDNQKDKQRFEKINLFLRTVLENGEATLEIPYKRDAILVHMDEKTLPLSSLGTGIHEVIIIAAAATLLEDAVLCIEEPELHLHPLLQKKLLQYLCIETNNQYIFTTHSAHLLDTEDIEVFHIMLDGGQTTIDAVTTTKQRSKICHDLGYRASDILQSNAIIWVEGPSDRIYINHWIKAKTLDNSLIEGIHYSIMFYGGRLFSHLTAEDLEDIEGDLEDFISVRKLNRNTCIVFDSDKTSVRSKLSPTKKRLKDEFNKGPGFAWITKGREIENYINADIIEDCVLNIHPSAAKILSKDQWSNLLKYETKIKPKKLMPENTANKVKVARYYVENYKADFSILDLKLMLDNLVTFIKKSNGKG
jgi:AAA15 family ATPase/GTPase